MLEILRHKKLSASGIIYSGPCVLGGILIGTDAANDPTITVFDAVAAAGNEVIPTNQYDASVLGLNGATIPIAVKCVNGIYVQITTGGSCEVTVFYKEIFEDRTI